MHPELDHTEINKKCHQLNHALHQINHTAKDSFIPGQNLIDEGGVLYSLNFCPIQQYNKDKPKQYQCEIFILYNAFLECNFCMDTDVYQGREHSSF